MRWTTGKKLYGGVGAMLAATGSAKVTLVVASISDITDGVAKVKALVDDVSAATMVGSRAAPRSTRKRVGVYVPARLDVRVDLGR